MQKLKQRMFTNCWIVFFALLFQRKLSGCLICFRWNRLPHVIGITHKKNYVHLREDKKFNIWYLYLSGYIEVINRNVYKNNKDLRLEWK